MFGVGGPLGLDCPILSTLEVGRPVLLEVLSVRADFVGDNSPSSIDAAIDARRDEKLSGCRYPSMIYHSNKESKKSKIRILFTGKTPRCLPRNVNLQLNDEANKCVVCGGEITRDETLCIVDDGANPLVQRMSEVEGTIRMRILCFAVSKSRRFLARSLLSRSQTVVSLPPISLRLLCFFRPQLHHP